MEASQSDAAKVEGSAQLQDSTQMNAASSIIPGLSSVLQDDGATVASTNNGMSNLEFCSVFAMNAK